MPNDLDLLTIITEVDKVGKIIAMRLDKLSAVCHSCGEDAMYTQRLIDGKPAPFDGPTVLVGATDSYEARCGTCFETGELI